MTNVKEEVERKLNNTSDCSIYTKDCIESAYKAYRSLEEDNHSGMSWGLTANLLIRMVKELPLSPITEEDTFHGCSYSDLEWCDRMSGLSRTKQSDGSYKYSDMHRYTTSNGFSSHIGEQILDEMFPITLPYWPTVQKYRLKVEDFSTDGKMGCFDTYAVYSVVTPEGDYHQINKFFKEEDDGWKPISQEEFEQRKNLSVSNMNKD